MSISYTKTIWKNHVVERPRTYTSQANQDSSRTDTPSPGTVYQQGTPINAEHLNNMENGIFAATEEVNRLSSEKAETVLYAVTLPSSGWTGSAAPYTKTVSLSGIRASDTPILDLVQTGDYAADQQLLAAWSLISRAVAQANAIIFTADAIPAADIQIQVRCVR